MATCYKRLSFSNEEEFKLIEFIKNHPALWDASDSEYGNSELRKLYWISLATELNKSVFECRRKWRFVRDYYIHKRRRHPESTPQRDGKYYSLQFLNKIKVISKKFSHHSNKSNGRQTDTTNGKTNAQTLGKIEVDYVEDSDEEIDYDFLDDNAFERITVERIGNDDDKYHTPRSRGNSNEINNYSRLHDTDTNDDKSDDFVFKEDYIDEESLVTADEFGKLQQNEENDGDEGEDRRNGEGSLVQQTNQNGIHMEMGNSQTDSTMTTTMLHEKAIDLFFESMAAAVKTFPPQFVAEAKCKVFMAFNEVEAKVYKNANKN